MNPSLKISLVNFIVAVVAFVVCDFLWLGLILKSFYMSQIGELLRTENGQMKPVLWAGALVYVLLSLGVVFLVLPRIAKPDSLIMTFLFGALLGMIVYGTYDMTNYSILTKWPLPITWIDWAWGTFVCGLVTVITKTARDFLF